jgi:ATP-dependent RNA helicase DeaD
MYTHRSGRTGRAGRKGRSLLIVPPFARRQVEYALHGARIKAEWQPVPTPDRVRKAIEKQGRRRVHALLDTPEGVADETQLAYAAQLLEGRDAATVVAALLRFAAPALPREPLPVSAVEVFERRPERGRPHPNAQRRHQPQHFARQNRRR